MYDFEYFDEETAKDDRTKIHVLVSADKHKHVHIYWNLFAHDWRYWGMSSYKPGSSGWHHFVIYFGWGEFVICWRIHVK